MAQRVAIELEDDLDGGPADETVKFGLGGSDYEIDLSTENASAFRGRIAPYIEHARKSAAGPRRQASHAAGGRERSGDIRAWAKKHGIEVSERGRIPASVIEQYQAARKS